MLSLSLQKLSTCYLSALLLPRLSESILCWLTLFTVWESINISMSTSNLPSIVYSFWDENDGFRTSDSDHPLVLSVSLAFAFLRRHLYKITPRCSERFKRGKLEAHNNHSDKRERASYGSNETEKVTSFLSLLRASSIAFPGETVLQEAEQFSTRFLSDWLTEKGHDPSDTENSLTKEVEHVLQFLLQSNPLL